jgi:molybdopterin-guanine dinucleotide biosynthesis protein A
LSHCSTPWLVTVPCDTPNFPSDLVRRLAAADADIALPVIEQDGRRQRQPVFCLMRASLCDDLAAFVQGGGRKIEHWIERHGAVDVPFADAAAFFNANTLDELRSLDRPTAHRSEDGS